MSRDPDIASAAHIPPVRVHNITYFFFLQALTSFFPGIFREIPPRLDIVSRFCCHRSVADRAMHVCERRGKDPGSGSARRPVCGPGGEFPPDGTAGARRHDRRLNCRLRVFPHEMPLMRRLFFCPPRGGAAAVRPGSAGRGALFRSRGSLRLTGVFARPGDSFSAARRRRVSFSFPLPAICRGRGRESVRSNSSSLRRRSFPL